MTVLDDILAARRLRLEETRSLAPLEGIRRRAEERKERRDFAGSISSGRLRVVAEAKKASPSRGLMCPDYRPSEIAQGYEAAGAAAISVLTEEQHFQGSLEHLQEARQAVRLPVLRKDFVIDDYQVYESVAAGADALLVIVAALSNLELVRLIGLASTLQIAALVEVHTEGELERAIDAGAKIIGVNNRDLRTLEVRLETSLRLRERIPSDAPAVSESGIKTVADLQRLSNAGYDAVLIGEQFMTTAHPGAALAALLQGFARPESEVQSPGSRWKSLIPR